MYNCVFAGCICMGILWVMGALSLLVGSNLNLFIALVPVAGSCEGVFLSAFCFACSCVDLLCLLYF